MVHMFTGDMVFLKFLYTKILFINCINPPYVVSDVHHVTSTLLLICPHFISSCSIHILLVNRYQQSNFSGFNPHACICFLVKYGCLIISIPTHFKFLLPAAPWVYPARFFSATRRLMFEATVVAHPWSYMTLEETILANLSRCSSPDTLL